MVTLSCTSAGIGAGVGGRAGLAVTDADPRQGSDFPPRLNHVRRLRRSCDWRRLLRLHEPPKSGASTMPDRTGSCTKAASCKRVIMVAVKVTADAEVSPYSCRLPCISAAPPPHPQAQ